MKTNYIRSTFPNPLSDDLLHFTLLNATLFEGKRTIEYGVFKRKKTIFQDIVILVPESNINKSKSTI